MSTTNQYPDFSGLAFEKVWAMFQETAQQFKETDKRIQETNKAINRLEKSVDETTSRLAKSIENSNKEHGSLGNRFGDVIEHLITPGVMPRFNAMGYHFTKASTRMKIVDPVTNKTITEMDIVLENGDAVIVVEIKVDPSLSDVKKHIRRLQIFREDRDKSSPNDSKKIFGAIAAAVFPKDVQEAALQAGFYVIVQGGDTITIDVSEGFVPTAFEKQMQ